MAEADKLIDDALRLVEEEPNQPQSDAPNREKALRQSPNASIKRGSPEEVRSEITAMKQQDVAWRNIEWKTCLLDGLKVSREQNKPMMLWVFIDRPIDDERC